MKKYYAMIHVWLHDMDHNIDLNYCRKIRTVAAEECLENEDSYLVWFCKEVPCKFLSVCSICCLNSSIADLFIICRLVYKSYVLLVNQETTHRLVASSNVLLIKKSTFCQNLTLHKDPKSPSLAIWKKACMCS